MISVCLFRLCRFYIYGETKERMRHLRCAIQLSTQRQASSMRGRNVTTIIMRYLPTLLLAGCWKRDGSCWERGRFGIGSGMWGREVAVDIDCLFGKETRLGWHPHAFLLPVLIIWGRNGSRERPQLTRLFHLLQRFQSFLAQPRTSLVFASGSRIRGILWLLLLIRRARRRPLIRSLLMLRLSLPLREFGPALHLTIDH